MNYRENFKELLKATLKGFIIGLIIAIVLSLWMFGGVWTEVLVGIALFTVLFGSAASIVICSRNKEQQLANTAVSRVFKGVFRMFFGVHFGSPVILIINVIRILIGILVIIPIGIYMAISYVLNLIYYGIMALLESKDKLVGKEDMCNGLDIIPSVLGVVVTVLLTIIVYKGLF